MESFHTILVALVLEAQSYHSTMVALILKTQPIHSIILVLLLDMLPSYGILADLLLTSSVAFAVGWYLHVYLWYIECVRAMEAEVQGREVGRREMRGGKRGRLGKKIWRKMREERREM